MKMMISHLIQHLQKFQKFQKEYGDLEAWVSDDGVEKPVEQLLSGILRDKRIVMIMPAFDHTYCLFGITFYADELEMAKRRLFPEAYE